MANFKIYTSPFPGDRAPFEDFEKRWMLLAAPKEFALFERTADDQRSHSYLLTPQAAAAFPNLGGATWVDALPSHLEMEGWGLGIGHTDAKEWFKLP